MDAAIGLRIRNASYRASVETSEGEEISELTEQAQTLLRRLREYERGWSPQNSTRPWIRFCMTAHYRPGQPEPRRR